MASAKLTDFDVAEDIDKLAKARENLRNRYKSFEAQKNSRRTVLLEQTMAPEKKIRKKTHKSAPPPAASPASSARTKLQSAAGTQSAGASKSGHVANSAPSTSGKAHSKAAAVPKPTSSHQRLMQKMKKNKK